MSRRQLTYLAVAGLITLVIALAILGAYRGALIGAFALVSTFVYLVGERGSLPQTRAQPWIRAFSTSPTRGLALILIPSTGLIVASVAFGLTFGLVIGLVVTAFLLVSLAYQTWKEQPRDRK